MSAPNTMKKIAQLEDEQENKERAAFEEMLDRITINIKKEIRMYLLEFMTGACHVRQ